MNEEIKMKGWKLLPFALLMGPFFLLLYSRETRTIYPAAKFFAWTSLVVMAVCAYLLFTFTFSPIIIRIAYCILFLILSGLAFMYCWVIDSKTGERKPGPKQRYSLSRALAWMFVMGMLFEGFNNVTQALYYWTLGEEIAVYFSARANLFKFWIFIGFIYGFIYGLKENSRFFNRDCRSAGTSVFFVFLFILLFNGLVLLYITFPLQRLTPVSYRPQLADKLFYILFFTALLFSLIYLIRAAHRQRFAGMCAVFFAGSLLVPFHAVVISGYSTTINLTAAAILEDSHHLDSAKALYAKSIPHIRYNRLLASLHHRQGVLHVLNQDYPSALAGFKRVLTDYSDDYEVYRKAFKYVKSYEKNKSVKGLGKKVLQVKHRTFEQAASCFPNSLSVILNFYEEDPISTRKLSYAIKESFSGGTFIWKADSFLADNGYKLLTTLWQDKEMLIALIDAGYPVLVYVPGHVYTLYGYDANMEIFFTYDTAKSNRWNDKPFETLQKDWMRQGFLMSVVVKKEDEDKFAALFPHLERFSRAYGLWQKTRINDYYARKQNFRQDYDRYAVSKSLGLERMKIGDRYFMSEAFAPFPWNEEQWNNDVLPVLEQEWVADWNFAEKWFLYLIYNGRPEEALTHLKIYQARLSEEGKSGIPRLLELKLAAALDAGDEALVQPVTEKLIGISDNGKSWSYWGHYFKARRLMASGDLKAALELLLPALKNIYLDEECSRSLKYIFKAVNDIRLADPSLIDEEDKPFLEVAGIYFGVDGE